MTPCCELRALDATNNSGLWIRWTTLGHELKALHIMKSVGLWLTWTNLGHELRALNAMNNLCMLMTWTTLSHELRSLDSINSSMLWMIHMIMGHELKNLDAMNNWGLWMIWMILGHELKALDTMNNSGLWMTKWLRVVCSTAKMLWTPHYCGWYELLTTQGYGWLNDFGSWAQDPRCYEHLIIMDDMNVSRSCDLRPLDAMSNLGLRMIWMILGREPIALNAMKS